MAGGLNLRGAVQSGVVGVLTDDAGMIHALTELADAVITKLLIRNGADESGKVSLPGKLPCRPLSGSRRGTRPARTRTRTGVSFTFQRTVRRRISAGKCWFSVLFYVREVWISELVEKFRGRPSVAHRYLTFEGNRGFTEIVTRIPLAADTSFRTGIRQHRPPTNHLRSPGGGAVIADPPEWFGVIEPSRILVHRKRDRP